MARKATGQVVERERTRGHVHFALRFRAYGRRQFVTLGSAEEGWTRQRAELELQNVLADVRRGIWQPAQPEPEPVEPQPEPTVHEFASEWLARRNAEGLRPRTLEYLRWALTEHLLPYFAGHRLTQVTVEEVDRYAHRKVAEGRLSNASVNKTLEVLTSVMEQAVEYGHVATNPAKGRRRRLPTTKPARLYLEPDQVTALLDAAGELDREDRCGRRYRRALLATLAFAGLRIGELLALRWGDVDLATGRLHIRESKTDAGVRVVDVQPELRDELLSLKARASSAAPTDVVFPTSSGKPDNRNNVRRRILVRAVKRANERIAKDGGCEPLPDQLSPHALRRTYASWLVAEGEDIAYVMGQLGHTDPSMTLGLYAKALRSKRRRPHAETDADEAPEWAPMGTNAAHEEHGQQGRIAA
jgi:integrase